MLIMAVKTKFSGETQVISRRIDATGMTNAFCWKDLGWIFQNLCSKWDQTEIDEMLKQHPQGAKIIEAIPQ